MLVTRKLRLCGGYVENCLHSSYGHYRHYDRKLHQPEHYTYGKRRNCRYGYSHLVCQQLWWNIYCHREQYYGISNS